MIFTVHVPIFFILSGYLYHDKQIWERIKGLFQTLILPYIFTGLIIVAGTFLIDRTLLKNLSFTTGLGSGKQAIIAVLYGVGTPTNVNGYQIQAIGAIWFLLAMFIGSVMFSCIVRVFRNYKYSVLLIWITSIVLLLVSTYKTFGLLPWSINAGLMSVIFYTFGYTLKQYNFLGKSPMWSVVIGFIFWIISALSGFFYVNVAYADNLILAVLGAFGGSIVIFKLSQLLLNFYFSRYLLLFGKYSLIILCFHVVDLDMLRVTSIINNYFVTQSLPIIGVLVAIIYRLLFVLVFMKLIPYVPIMRSFFLPRQFPLRNIFVNKDNKYKMN